MENEFKHQWFQIPIGGPAGALHPLPTFSGYTSANALLAPVMHHTPLSGFYSFTGEIYKMIFFLTFFIKENKFFLKLEPTF